VGNLERITAGRWPEILSALAGLPPHAFNGQAQGCPACTRNGIAQGKGRNVDRFRWDQSDGMGAWYCNQCGGKHNAGGGGNGPDLLMRMLGCEFPEAAAKAEAYCGLVATAQPVTPGPSAPAPAKRTRKPARVPTAPPAGTPPPELEGAEEQYPYGADLENPSFWIQRISRPPKVAGGKPDKIFVHRTWLDGRWHRPSKRDDFTSEWPAPRPIYRLPQLLAALDAPVLVVEGERTANRAALLFPDHVVVSWCHGKEGKQHTDWAAMAGRSCTLWPDNDRDGRAVMAWLAEHLQGLGCTVAVVIPPEGVPAKWDLGDAAGDGWTPERAAAELGRLAQPVLSGGAPEPPKPPEPPASEPGRPERPRYPFDLLGFDNGSYFYQPHNTGQVMRLTAASHNAAHLNMLAPLQWWEAEFPGGRSGPNYVEAASHLYHLQHQVGIFDPGRIRGRGAWWDNGRSILHLGDRLLVDGVEQPLQLPGSRFKYQRLAAIELPADVVPLSSEQGAEIITIAGGFLWDVPASGLLLAGWTALAPIGGALMWRPHLWLTAGKGSGKSTLLDRFLGTLLEDLALWPEGSSTEASLRQELRCDALPVVMDEAESNEQSDRTRMQSILALARVSSSSSRGFVGRGGADGIAQRFMVRSMFLLCSINPALKHGADESRFAQLTMRNPSTLPPGQREAHWRDLDQRLTAEITPGIGHALAARMVRLIPVVRDAVAVFRSAAAKRLGSQRQGDQYGTLLAGAWCLMHDRVPSEAEALQLINEQDWEPYREAAEQSDEQRCLQKLLQHQARVEVERIVVDGARVNARSTIITRSVWELAEAVRNGNERADVPADAAVAHLGRLGFRVDGDRLLVSNTAEGVRGILRDTPWGASWSTVLGRLDGAEKAGPTRFQGIAGVSRSVSIRVFGE
jgi:putative DNA primase/helicase